MHDGSARSGRTAARRAHPAPHGPGPRTGAATAADAAAWHEEWRRALLRAAAAAALAAGALAATACGGDGSATHDEAPARGADAGAVSASGGETDPAKVPGAGISGVAGDAGDTTAARGVAGSGTAAIGSPQGSIYTPGEGTLQSGDLSDAGVRAVVDAIHATEVETAQLALQRSQTAGVRDYAQAMLAAHRAAPLARVPAVAGANAASDLLVPLREYHVKTMQAMRAASGPAFDRVYVNSQVASHQGALQTLERLETAARGDALTQRLRTLQGQVQRHLDEARALQSRIGNAEARQSAGGGRPRS